MINLSTKSEVPNLNRYGNMRGVTKCRKWSGLAWLWITKVIENNAIRQSAYDFLFAFNRSYTSVLYRL